MACVELHHLESMLQTLVSKGGKAVSAAQGLLSKSLTISTPLCAAVHRELPAQGSIAYEVDGFGGKYFMDDANLPSLLSLPVMG
ncbi:metal-independent alpha-mannosidase, partial [archaeon]